MNKKKLLYQLLICVAIVVAVNYCLHTSNTEIRNVYSNVKAKVMAQYTFDDVKAAGVTLTSFIKGAPAKVVSAVTTANSVSKYGEPIDEKSDNRYLQVHSVAGGKIIASGKSEMLGLFVKVKHEDAESIYGHLSDINVVENERVQRGEIIGSYDTNSQEEFYYDLEKNV